MIRFFSIILKIEIFQLFKALHMFSSAPSLAKLVQNNCYFFSTFIEIYLRRELIRILDLLK